MLGLIEDESGNQLRRFIAGDEAALLGDTALRPLTHALLLATQGAKTLFVFNHYKQYWELPGGIIDPGETPAHAAVRELEEESGQQVEGLRFVGIMEIYLAKGAKIEYGALYAGRLDRLRPFEANAEVERIQLWDLKEEIGFVTAIDRALAEGGAR